ncbi:MAG: M48 family metalloprotease [Thermoanaerobaculia bacterium]
MPRRLGTSAALAVLLSTLTLPAPAPAQTVEKKELFKKSLEAATQAVEYYGELDRPEELRRVAEIGYRLAQESLFQEMPFTFYLVDMPEPNAFALPGGQIFLTRGMLDLPLDDDMLAGLLGHELGHVVLEHGLKMKRRATLLNVISQAVLAGVIIGADSGSNKPTNPYDPTGGEQSNRGDIIYGTAAAGAVVSELLLRNYSREFEDEADEEGQRLAAAAGFDPIGTSKLMDTMRAHMPQSREYGYWRTHPFFEERVKAAAVRQELLKIQPAETAAEYRVKTQASLMALSEVFTNQEELAELLRDRALVAWPQGETADGLRLEKLRESRDLELAETDLRQDFGSLIALYHQHLGEVRELTPESPLIGILDQEVSGFRASRDKLYPRAREVFAGGIYETEFLETFLSNFPQAPEVPEVALALATAYSRIGRQADAVGLYMQASAAPADSAAGQQASRGLRNLASFLDRLDALQRLASDSDDPEVRRLAGERLAKLAPTYEELANGAAYLKSFPAGEWAAVINKRLNALAEKLHGEVILYQTVGDHVKGIERIQQILTHAPNSPAADRLRESMVLES